MTNIAPELLIAFFLPLSKDAVASVAFKLSTSKYTV
jgi:hypothetical protein